MRALVTGSRGFVGGWLCQHLRDTGDEVIEVPDGVDLCDQTELARSLADVEFDVCYHLAALSHVGQSWSDPELYYRNNVLSTANLVAVLARKAGPPRLIHVSSSEVYGRVPAGDLPICETQPLRPVSPYAASKAAAELVALQGSWGHSMPVVIARPFNHTGPKQSSDFLIPALVTRILAAKASRQRILKVGNVGARRDFLDVRDVVRAYRGLAVTGIAGEVYNVCKGEAASVRDIAELAASVVGWEVVLEVDPQLLRPDDVELVLGDPTKLHLSTGFTPELSLRSTVESLVAQLL